MLSMGEAIDVSNEVSHLRVLLTPGSLEFAVREKKGDAEEATALTRMKTFEEHLANSGITFKTYKRSVRLVDESKTDAIIIVFAPGMKKWLYELQYYRPEIFSEDGIRYNCLRTKTRTFRAVDDEAAKKKVGRFIAIQNQKARKRIASEFKDKKILRHTPKRSYQFRAVILQRVVKELKTDVAL